MDGLSPRIWVDADACPAPVRDILLRAAERAKLELTLVANRALRKPPSRYVKMLVVPQGFDVADNRIVELARPGDLVVTADIPLAAAVVARGAMALNPRGELYTEENVRERLGMRDMLDELRGAGVRTGGPPALGPQDRAAFANQLDRWLSRAVRAAAGTGPA